MSLDAHRKKIRCDNRDCGQDTVFPIERERCSVTDTLRSTAKGWVFVAGGLEQQHYCPACAPMVLHRGA
jgi:hypothetical protein